MGFQVKEEEEEKKISEGDEDILEFVIPGKCPSCMRPSWSAWRDVMHAGLYGSLVKDHSTAAPHKTSC